MYSSRSNLRILFTPFLLWVATLAAPAADAPLRWLDKTPPPQNTGVSFGVPWPRGAIKKDQVFALNTADGKGLPVQTWPLAYWPDGSLKWVGVATVAGPESGATLTLTTGTGAPVAEAGKLRIRESDTTIEIDTGVLRCRVPKWGADLIDSLTVENREIARQGRLVCVLQDGPDGDVDASPAREKFGTKLEKVTVEQSGPLRAVLKLEGHHKGLRSTREWLPFVVRLYFYAGQRDIRLVHTIVYDGNEQKDFIRGLGVTFAVPLREQIQNRHVRFGGEGDGLWAEPIQPMIGRGGRFVANPQGGADVYPEQIAGRRVPNREEVSPRSQGFLADWASWDGFKLIQPNADGFTIVKRTNVESCWLPANAGKRASGLAFVGDTTGGLAVSLKNFWQSFPASLEITGATTNAAQLTVWLWSPDAPAMDMRHYDTRPHGLESAYEDVQPGMSIPLGVARTSELTLFPTASVPSKNDTARLAQTGAQPPLLVCTPQYLHDAQAFGIWGLEDRSTPVKKAIEERLDATLAYYLGQIDQRNWYGFWDYGDVMHSYDATRHMWRYDLGGMAWANSELGPDLWLWYSFVRSGRADVFRMAEAMTRHTGEVDCYHLGPFAGLGSRHNVRHWGCGAKEARISQAAYRRFHYYLTTDERTGDLMREVVNADYKTLEFDPMRLAQPITEAEKKVAPTRVRLGPDWLAFLGNWMTEWERTGDTRWRDKILTGVKSLGEMPLGLRTGKNLVFGYDPETGKLHQLSEEPGQYNLATIMGGAEVVFELNLMLDDPQWHKLWLQYCRLYSAPRDTIEKDMQTGHEGADAAFVRDGRLSAYVFRETKNEAFARAAINSLLRAGRGRRGNSGPQKIAGPDSLRPVDAWPQVGTNGASQAGLEAIAMLGMVGDRLPAEFPAQLPAEPEGEVRRGRRPPPETPGGPVSGATPVASD
jgi:hypothetical protein